MSSEDRQPNSGKLVSSPPEEGASEHCSGASENISGESLIAKTVGKHYQIISYLGQGGMSTVYKAKDLKVDRFVAIKFLRLEGKSTREQMMLRFQREARVVGCLDHPNIISIHALDFTLERQPFLVMDYVEGESLAERLHRTGAVPCPESIEIFIQICDGVSHAHENGILHRDLKPSNIMLVGQNSSNVCVKILDFGIAKLVDESTGNTQQLTKTGDVFGSPLYMSPEQGLGKSLTVSSDLYSIGCLMFETLTGVPPFLGKTVVETILKHQTEAAPTLKEASLGKTMPARLEGIVSMLLDKDPSGRFQSVQNLGAELRSLQSSLRNTLVAPNTVQLDRSPPRLLEQRSYLRPLFILGAVFVLATGLILAPFYFNRNRIEPKPQVLNENKGSEEIIRDLPKLSQEERDDGKVAFDAKYTPNLLMVDYKGYRLSAQGFAELAKMKNIINLDLSASSMDDAGLEALQSMKHLNQLALARSQITDKGLDKIERLNLALLDLSDTKITDVGLVTLGRMNTLRSLSLAGTSISNQGLKSIADLKSLAHLNLSHTGIGDPAIKYLGTLTDLEELNLEDTGISNRGLAHLQQIKSLESLDLAGTAINDAGLSALASLKRLRYLNLSKTEITNAGLNILLRLPSLKNICLDRTRITDAGLASLLKLNNPSRLGLQNCSGLSKQGLARLKYTFPNCEISFVPEATSQTNTKMAP